MLETVDPTHVYCEDRFGIREIRARVRATPVKPCTLGHGIGKKHCKYLKLTRYIHLVPPKELNSFMHPLLPHFFSVNLQPAALLGPTRYLLHSTCLLGSQSFGSKHAADV